MKCSRPSHPLHTYLEGHTSRTAYPWPRVALACSVPNCNRKIKHGCIFLFVFKYCTHYDVEKIKINVENTTAESDDKLKNTRNDIVSNWNGKSQKLTGSDFESLLSVQRCGRLTGPEPRTGVDCPYHRVIYTHDKLLSCPGDVTNWER